MPASEITRKVYRPSATVGLLYAKVYGSAAPLTPVGNVLELVNEFKEDVEKQDDMIQYEKVDGDGGTMRIDIFDASVFACVRKIKSLEKSGTANRWLKGGEKDEDTR